MFNISDERVKEIDEAINGATKIYGPNSRQVENLENSKINLLASQEINLKTRDFVVALLIPIVAAWSILIWYIDLELIFFFPACLMLFVFAPSRFFYERTRGKVRSRVRQELQYGQSE